MNAPFESWECWARPAPTGRRCGHQNAKPSRYRGTPVCEACGCTKFTSDARKERGDRS